MLTVMQEIRGLLHPRHSILTELRSRIIPTMTKRKGFGVMGPAAGAADTDFALKQRLCLENMSVIDIVDPGLSPSRQGFILGRFTSIW